MITLEAHRQVRQFIKDPTLLGSYLAIIPKRQDLHYRFLSSDEVFTSRYGLNSNIYHPKKTRSKPQRQKKLEFQVNPNKKPTLTSSSSHDSVEDNKKKGQDIGIIKFLMASLLNNLSKPSETPNQKDPQPLSSRQIAKSVTSQIQVPVTTRPNQTKNLYQDACNWRRIKHTKKRAKYQRNLFQ